MDTRGTAYSVRGCRPSPKADQLAYAPRLMKVGPAARYVGLSETKFLELVAAGKLPQPKEIDGAALSLWDRIELDDAADDMKTKQKTRRLNPISAKLGLEEYDDED